MTTLTYYYYHYFLYIASPQDNSSNDVSTLISEVTDQEVVIEDVNLQHVKVTLPSGKTVTKCLFCDKTWEKIVSTAKKAHLANKQR